MIKKDLIAVTNIFTGLPISKQSLSLLPIADEPLTAIRLALALEVKIYSSPAKFTGRLSTIIKSRLHAIRRSRVACSPVSSTSRRRRFRRSTWTASTRPYATASSAAVRRTTGTSSRSIRAAELLSRSERSTLPSRRSSTLSSRYIKR